MFILWYNGMVNNLWYSTKNDFWDHKLLAILDFLSLCPLVLKQRLDIYCKVLSHITVCIRWPRMCIYSLLYRSYDYIYIACETSPLFVLHNAHRILYA